MKVLDVAWMAGRGWFARVDGPDAEDLAPGESLLQEIGDLIESWQVVGAPVPMPNGLYVLLRGSRKPDVRLPLLRYKALAEARLGAIREAAKCPRCGNFAWDSMMQPALLPSANGSSWHHPACLLVRGR